MPRILFGEDQLSATLLLEPGESLDEPSLYQFLEARGVVHGVLGTAVSEVVRATGPLAIEIARGEPAVPGHDARIEPTFEGSRREHLVPVIGFDGRADYRNLGFAVNVVAGQVLARRVPPVAARAGMTVQGRIIQPPFPRDRQLRAGPGAMLSEDGNEVVAAIAGNPILDGDAIGVRKEFALEQGVSLKTGNIDFDGDVRIEGDVQRSMTVQATGSIWIAGSVEGCRIEAGGGVTILGGVLARAEIAAGGSVFAKFVEHATLRCRGSLRVLYDILHSEVESYGPVEAGGAVIGGELRSYSQGRTRYLGNRAATATQLAVTPPPAELKDAPALEAELAKVRESLVALSTRIRQSIQAPPTTQAEAEGRRKMLHLARLMTQREAALVQRLAALGEARPAGEPYFDVTDILYPGVRIALGSLVQGIDEAMVSQRIYSDGYSIRFAPLSGVRT